MKKQHKLIFLIYLRILGIILILFFIKLVKIISKEIYIYLHCRIQPALLCMEWNKKNDLNCYINLHNHGNSLLLIIFQRYEL